MATKTRSTATRAEESAFLATPEFQHLPLFSIVIGQQIRSKIDTESDSFKALQESIHVKGIVQPVVVAGPTDGKYDLICGERRCLAAQRLGFETVPCRILNPITQKDEIISFQLTENLQREDLNPIDLANAILSLFQARHPENQFDVDGVMAVLVSYNRRPDYLSEALSLTVRDTARATGKSVPTLFNALSLLKLSVKVQTAILEEKLSVSQGYIFAAKLSSPVYEKVLAWALRQPRTNAEIEEKFAATTNPEAPRPSSRFTFKKECDGLVSWKKYMAANPAAYTKDERQRLIDQLDEVRELLAEQME